MLPINIPNHLPAKQVLESEHIFVMDESRAFHQDIRPQKIVILNLMPKKSKRKAPQDAWEFTFTSSLYVLNSEHTYSKKYGKASIWMNFIRIFPASATNGLTE